MATETRKKNKKLFFYTLILESIKKDGTLPKDRSRQFYYYYAKDLVSSGFIRYEASGVWKLTEVYKRLESQGHVKKSNLIGKVKPDTSRRVKKDNVRGHGFAFRLKAPRSNDWLKKIGNLNKFGFKAENLGNGNRRVIIDGNKTHFNQRSLIMHFNRDYSFIGKSGEATFRNAIEYFISRVRLIERRLGINFRYDGRYLFKCFRHHFAHLGNVLGKKCKIEGKSYRITRKDGSAWLEIDFSNNNAEVEAVNSRTGVYDIDTKIKPLFDEVDKNPHFIRDVKTQIKDLTQMVSNLTLANQRMVQYLQETKDSGFGQYKY